MNLKAIAKKIGRLTRKHNKLEAKMAKIQVVCEQALAEGKITTKQYNALCDGKTI